MATQAIEQAPAPAPAPASGDAPPPTKGKRSVLILAAAGLLAGGAAGFLGVGPILAKRRAASPAPAKAETPAAAVNHAIENIVLNPAGSGGTHFLMVTATFELTDGAAEELMKTHEAEIRDRLLGLFGRLTVEELGDIAQRDHLKQQVLEVVAPLLPKGAVRKVFFPQFVIQ